MGTTHIIPPRGEGVQKPLFLVWIGSDACHRSPKENGSAAVQKPETGMNTRNTSLEKAFWEKKEFGNSQPNDMNVGVLQACGSA